MKLVYIRGDIELDIEIASKPSSGTKDIGVQLRQERKSKSVASDVMYASMRSRQSGVYIPDTNSIRAKSPAIVLSFKE